MITIRLSPHYDSDFVIVGAGPAGAAAAIHLAREGFRVILADQCRFPRDKVCGDFVGPVTLVELMRLGINELPEYRQTNIIRRASLYLNGKHMITSQIPAVPGFPAYGRVIPRKQLDHWILQAARAAGVEVMEGCRVQSYSVDPDGVRVVFESGAVKASFYTRAIIGADGSTSLISRLMNGRAAQPKDRILAVRAYFDGITGPSDHADLYFNANSFPGYCWLFPAGYKKANVGVGMLLETLPSTEENLPRMLERLIREDPALRERLGEGGPMGKVAGWPLNTYNRSARIVAERVLLVGDAAGLINPLNGEGIQYALLSARWAAESLCASSERNDYCENALRAYVDRVGQELRYDMALSGMIVQLIRNRSLNPVWMLALKIIITRARVDPSYADIAGSVLAGIAPSTSIVTYQIVMSTIRQAAVTLGIDLGANLLRGPRHWVKQGKQTAQAGIDMLAEVAQDPGGYLEWGMGVGGHGVELARQIVVHRNDATSEHLRKITQKRKAAARKRPVLKITLDHVNNQLK